MRKGVIEFNESRNSLIKRTKIINGKVKNIKKITDENMLNILREIDNIYTIINRFFVNMKKK